MASRSRMRRSAPGAALGPPLRAYLRSPAGRGPAPTAPVTQARAPRDPAVPCRPRAAPPERSVLPGSPAVRAVSEAADLLHMRQVHARTGHPDSRERRPLRGPPDPNAKRRVTFQPVSGPTVSCRRSSGRRPAPRADRTRTDVRLPSWPRCCTLLLYAAVRSVRIMLLNCGAMGIRTPDLLHAMNHSPVLRPGDMRPDQATRELTLAAAGPGEHPPAAFCPSDCPSKCSADRPRCHREQLSNTYSLIMTANRTMAGHHRLATAEPRGIGHDRRASSR